MTIGERIIQKRKELGLSQEALGDQMGVSRQAIYKWESDAALPEIEKLVALSKLFGVSVGWLLGVEEESAPEQANADSLNETQLDMVEQIVKRYIQFQPVPKPRKKWPWVLAACLLMLVFIQLFGRIDQLSSQYSNLHYSVSSITGSVNSQINGLANRVEEILKAQNQLTAEFNTELESFDYRNNTVTISMKAVPKTFVQGMNAVFVVESGGVPQEIECTPQAGGGFSAEAEVALTDSITITVVFVTPDGTRQTQVLESYSRLLSDSFPELRINDYDLMFVKLPAGKLIMENWYVTTREEGPGKGNAQITQYRLGIFLNQKLIGWAEPCEKPKTFYGDYTDQQFFRMPKLALENLQEGDIITVAAQVTDSYGREFMACHIPYAVEYESDGELRLNCVSVVSYDRDPAKWILD